MSSFLNSPQGELHKHLVENVGEGVYDAVERSEIAIGNRPAPAQPDPPVVAAPTAVPATPQADPASAPAASPEPVSTGSQPTERLLLGKYKTESEAEKGYHELLRMNKALLQQVDTLSLPATTQPATTTPAPESVVTTSTAGMERLKAIEDLTGVPAADLHTALVEIAKETARQESESTYKRITEPQEKRLQADAFMDANYPEAVKFADEIAQFVKTDPVTNAVVKTLWDKGDYQNAMIISHNNWRLNMGAQQEHKLLVAEEVRKEEVAEARIDAGLMSTNAQSARENTETGVTGEEFDKLVAMSRAGYNKPLLRATIGKLLPDNIFGVDAQG